MIGVGVITMGLRPIKDYRLSEGSELFVYTDTDRKGPGHARNAVLRHFHDKGYEHIFIFDDDCFPRAPGWEQYFINQAKLHGIGFFGMPEHFKDHPVAHDGEMVWWNLQLMQFAYYSRAFLDVVGGFNTAYDRYGFEDSAYIHRAQRSGMLGKFSEIGFPSPIRVLAYIHSGDVFNDGQEQNISFDDKKAYIAKNYPIFQDEIKSARIHYPF